MEEPKGGVHSSDNTEYLSNSVLKPTARNSSSEGRTQENSLVKPVDENNNNGSRDDKGDKNNDSDNQQRHGTTTDTHERQDSFKDDLPSEDIADGADDENDNLLLHKDEEQVYTSDNKSSLQIKELNVTTNTELSPEVQDVSSKSGNNRQRRKKQRQDSESELPVGFEAVLMELGSPGKFFWFQFLLNSLTSFCLSNTALIYVFIGFEPPHTCKQLLNESEFLAQYDLSNASTSEVHYGTCNITITSNVSGKVEKVATFGCIQGHDFKGKKHMSFVAEWDMVCDNVGLKELVQTIMMIGQTLGGVIFTSIGDKFGRKPMFLVCNLLLGAAGLGAAHASNIYMLIGLRFLAGFFQQGAGLLSYTIVMESLTAKYRRVAGVLSGLFWTTSALTLGVMAYLIRDESWRMLQIAAALFTANVFLYPFLLCESPRWLIANKKYDKALAIVKKACWMNGKDYEKLKVLFDNQVVHGQYNNQVSDKKVERYSLLDILRHRTLFVSVLIMFFIWITNSSTYYGLFLASSALAGDRHLNFILMGMVDLPADVVNIFLFAYFGRKPVIMGWLMTAGSGLLTATMLMALGSSSLTRTLSTVFSLLAKFGIGGSFNSIFIYTPELFPTNLRSAGLGICSSASRLGGMIAPYSQSLADVILWGPGCLFSGMCFVSALLFFKLPETRGQPMPTTVRDMKERAINQRNTRKIRQENFEMETLTQP